MPLNKLRNAFSMVVNSYTNRLITSTLAKVFTLLTSYPCCAIIYCSGAGHGQQYATIQ